MNKRNTSVSRVNIVSLIRALMAHARNMIADFGREQRDETVRVMSG